MAGRSGFLGVVVWWRGWWCGLAQILHEYIVDAAYDCPKLFGWWCVLVVWFGSVVGGVVRLKF